MKKARHFSQLLPGERFVAKVEDIKPGQVTIQLESGDRLTAKSLVLPDARIGEDCLFFVKDNAKGQILLEMVKGEFSPAQNNIAKAALREAEIAPSPQNLALVKSLMDAQWALDAQTLQKAAFFKNAADLTVDEVLLLLQEDFPATQQTVDTLEGIMSKKLELGNLFAELIEEIFACPDQLLKKELIGQLLVFASAKNSNILKTMPQLLPWLGPLPTFNDLLNGLFNQQDEQKKNDGLQTLQKQIHQNMFMSPKEDDQMADPDALEYFYKQLYQLAEQIGRRLKNSKAAGGIQQTIEFMTQMGKYKEYYQLPFVSEGKRIQGELFIFKDGKGRSRHDANCLIAIGLSSLGHVEVFVQKRQKKLSLQFRAEKEKTLKFIRYHAAKLTEALKSKGYGIEKVSYKTIQAPFSLLDSPDTNTSATNNKGARRYTFDMRI